MARMTVANLISFTFTFNDNGLRALTAEPQSKTQIIVLNS